MSYKDGGAYCEATDQTVTLRCDVHGVITCRGPENTKKYQRKCKSNTVPLCAVGLMAEEMRRAKLEGFQEKKEMLREAARLDVTFRKPIGELPVICKGAKRPVIISVYGNGVVKCSAEGCELLNHKNCPTMRLSEATKQIIAAKVRLGKGKLTPEEFKEGLAKAREKLDGLVE